MREFIINFISSVLNMHCIYLVNSKPHSTPAHGINTAPLRPTALIRGHVASYVSNSWEQLSDLSGPLFSPSYLNYQQHCPDSLSECQPPLQLSSLFKQQGRQQKYTKMF